jgi:TolB-like protein
VSVSTAFARERRQLHGAVALVALVASGCGYRLAGQNTFLPERIRVVAITPFENRTERPEIEQRVTEQVSREFSKRRSYQVIAGREGADAVLEGAVTGFRTEPVQFNAQGRATRVETIVTIDATFRDLSNDEILWSQANLLFRAQYDVQDVPVTAGAGGVGFFDQETLALDDIAEGAAGVLVNSILEGF